MTAPDTTAEQPGEPAGDPATALAARLTGTGLRVGYGPRTIIADLDVLVPDGSFTVIVGPNACGKSTLLRALSRLLTPERGEVLLDGRPVHSYKGKEFAREIGLLPQQSIAPEGITVIDLVARGRFPYQRMFQQWSDDDQRAVDRALAVTRLTELSTRPVEALSGGQRQRVWIAMAIAQGTDILLLDEPTTFLDLTHQIDVLDLLTDLNRERGRTVVCVLHDLNLACRYAHHLVAMRTGHIVAEGDPATVVTEDLVREVFGLDARVVPDPISGTPLIVPIGRHHTAGGAPVGAGGPDVGVDPTP